MPGVPCWIDTAQPDPEAAVAFYGGLFGWAFEDRMPIDAPGRYFVAQLHDRDVAAVGSQPEGHAAPPAWSTYVWVESADAAAAKAQDAGGEDPGTPFDVVDAGRMAALADARAPRSASGRRGRARAPSSSTSPARPVTSMTARRPFVPTSPSAAARFPTRATRSSRSTTPRMPSSPEVDVLGTHLGPLRALPP
jgi:predicted enzyme related to lactoylglutathione lyase